jgi:hypothetical protein
MFTLIACDDLMNELRDASAVRSSARDCEGRYVRFLARFPACLKGNFTWDFEFHLRAFSRVPKNA